MHTIDGNWHVFIKNCPFVNFCIDTSFKAVESGNGASILQLNALARVYSVQLSERGIKLLSVYVFAFLNR